MTKEEAINTWLPIIKMGVEKMPECKEALDIAIKALEQEPCEDAISRQTTINTIANTCFWLSGEDWNELMKCIESIPFVIPQPKTAHCIRTAVRGKSSYCCSHCSSECCYEPTAFCPDCGFEMVEVRDKEIWEQYEMK